MADDDDLATLARDLRLALGRVARRLRRAYVDDADDATRDPGQSLGFLELAVLQRLDRDGPSSPGGLAGDEGVTSAAVAASLTALEAKGMVTRRRAPDDGRRVVVAIAPAGRDTLRHRESASVARVERALRQLTTTDRRRVAAAIPLLERVAEAL